MFDKYLKKAFVWFVIFILMAIVLYTFDITFIGDGTKFLIVIVPFIMSMYSGLKYDSKK